MTTWEHLFAECGIVFSVEVFDAPELVEAKAQLADLDARIAEHEHMMHIAEMADDRYYTNGRRQRHQAELLDMRGDRKFVAGRVSQLSKIN